jgi:hypothetical protein
VRRAWGGTTQKRGKGFGKIQGRGLTRGEGEGEGERALNSGQSVIMCVPARRAAVVREASKGRTGVFGALAVVKAQ